jgi:hypothetical protein
MRDTDISKAYASLIVARNAWALTQARLMRAEDDLESDKTVTLLSGTIDGKNAEVREAQLRERCVDAYDGLSQAKHDEITARAEFDMCRYEVARINDMLRLMEIGTGGESAMPETNEANEALRAAMSGAAQL